MSVMVSRSGSADSSRHENRASRANGVARSRPWYPPARRRARMRRHMKSREYWSSSSTMASAAARASISHQGRSPVIVSPSLAPAGRTRYTEPVLQPLTRLLKIPEERRALTPPELQFVSSCAKRRTNCSGRRAGKSFSVTLWLVEQWKRRPNQSSIFLALSQESAIKIGWDALREFNDRFSWGAVYNGTDATWTWPNGFTLYYMGCKDRRSANLVRGVPKIHRVGVDECGQIADPLLEYLVVDVIEPTLADTDGDLCLLGTPADTGVGFYEDEMAACAEAGAHFCWTAAENPHLEKPGSEFIAEALAKRFAGRADNATF